MKKLFLFTLAALMVSAGAFAQEPEEGGKRRKGGFLRGLAKGVESVTGLDVSKETVFVYPTVSDWKLSLVSCEGNLETGAVVIKINAVCLGDAEGTRAAAVRSICPAGTDDELELFFYSKYYEFKVGLPTELTFTHAEKVPTDVKALDMKFYIEHAGHMPSEFSFEARDIPITWQ